jgi:hypothetical protein
MQFDCNPPQKPDSFLTERTRHLIESRRSEADSWMQRALANPANPTAAEFIDTRTRYALELLAAYAIPALEDIGRPRDLNDFLRDLEMEKGYLLGMLMPAIAEDLLRLYPLESADDFERRFGLLIDSDFDGWQSEGHRKVANQAGSAPLSEHAVNADMDSHDHPTGEHPNKTLLNQVKRKYKLVTGENLTNPEISKLAGYESQSCTEIKAWSRGDRRNGKADAKFRKALESVMSDTPPAVEAEKVRRKQQISKKTEIS